MQKDVEMAQEQFAGTYDRIIKVHHEFEAAQKRVVAAQEDLVKGLQKQLEAMQALLGEVGSNPAPSRCDMA
jgi:hypothetical protein